MSAEEEEIPVEPQCTDVLSPDPSNPTRPTKLNKNGKPRKVLSPEALEKLKLAREKANAIRKQNTVKKLEEKVEKMEKTDTVLKIVKVASPAHKILPKRMDKVETQCKFKLVNRIIHPTIPG